ncbi:MAG: DUF1653 domain-containing protein [Candidatus Harrisonbacteria bacterium CG10_big_fil_rev_8_21_14_0_10_49_15]|uniref:DUF1653 domain-containing protein n=1 Tax=Candidatus Harrisonbacteria bacterium CG10_big_fil_rev_8_21_14_0_10_49_15 TaxID=1974587 RepID=A0A2H0UKM3_9BACT|nr:MAG: DUF1653 domain-containing protein [Candidatus Harrisonbacteria bacterium CG10_big_fil_rev_8_21_14_0_10_49_15]
MEIKVGTYKHYKGDEVEVFGVALHSETLEELVLYRHTTGDKKAEQHYWVRPKAMFLETVQKDGKTMPRFEYMEE